MHFHHLCHVRIVMRHVLVVSEPHHGVLLAGRSTQLFLSRFNGFHSRDQPPCRRSVFALNHLESLRSDKLVSLPYSGIFIFPFSLRVGHLLVFHRGECTTESPLLAGSSLDCSYRLSRSFGPLNRREVGLSVSISGSSRGIPASLTSSSELGLESRFGVGGRYQDADSSNTTSRLTRACLVRGLLSDQDALLGLCVQLPPFFLRYMHIRNATEHPQVSQVRLCL